LGDALSAYVTTFAKKGPSVAELEGLITRHASSLTMRPLASISTQELLTALAPVQASLPKTAVRVRAAVSTCFDHAIAAGLHSGGNPASQAVFKFLVPPPPPWTPHRMCPIADIPDLWARLQDKASAPQLCLSFLLATATRTQEALYAQWPEISLVDRSWLIPASRIKMRRDFCIPLNDAALEILATARASFPSSHYVFPGRANGRLSPRSLEAVLHKRLNLPYAVHRSGCQLYSPF
jgi:integrase